MSSPSLTWYVARFVWSMTGQAQFILHYRMSHSMYRKRKHIVVETLQRGTPKSPPPLACMSLLPRFSKTKILRWSLYCQIHHERIV